MPSGRGRILGEVRSGAIAVSEIAYAGGSMLGTHRHRRAYVSVLVEGAYTELRDGMPRYCTTGTVIVHPPGEVHADYFVAPGRCINFDVHDDRADTHAALLRAARATHPGAEQAIRTALPGLVDKLPQSAAPEWLPIVLRDFRWVQAGPLQGAADLAGTHPTHFARTFRKYVGMTPGRYRRRERVRAASQLLLGSPVSLSDIAFACGFADQSHLTNVFRETAGISPKRFRSAFAR